jgi:hypothetical protein
MGIALLVAGCLAFDIRGGQGQGSSDRTERVMTKNHIGRKEKGSSGLKRNKKKSFKLSVSKNNLYYIFTVVTVPNKDCT